MNVLLIGSGGREHALAWGLRRSPKLTNLWCAPGNAGIESVARVTPLDVRDHDAVLAFVKEKQIDLTVVGPEAPLVAGLADDVRAAGGRVFGPGRAAARLEGSKAFAKRFMRAHGIPTADFAAFSRADEALGFVRSKKWPETWRVVKASGLAAGKGVVVASDRAAVLAALDAMMVKKVFGAAGDEVVLEEVLTGEELSVMALCDGATLSPFSPSQDHKRVFDDDKGPNTGGMGAYAPAPQATDALWRRIEEQVFAPFLAGLKAEGLDYRGVIYFGLMLTPDGPKVLEFNTRFGDPETQVVAPLVSNDWLDLFSATVDGRLKGVAVGNTGRAAVCVVMTAAGYPGDYAKGLPIEGLEALAREEDVLVFHAGTARGENGVVTGGGRVLGVTALAADLAAARRRVYEAVGAIRFDGAHHRKDIAARALRVLGA